MIELSNLNFGYKGQAKLFDNLDLSIKTGSIYGLLGRNGAGKSTLLKTICGALFADSGRASVFGLNPIDRKPELLAQLFIVPEDFSLEDSSIGGHVKYTAPFYPLFNHALFAQLLDEFELSPEMNLNKVSYGQKKKFMIAFGIATEAKLLLMDEPTNGLDIPSKSQFRKIIASAFSDEKIILISTHQVRDLENLIDTVLILEKGKIMYNQPIHQTDQKIDLEVLFNEVVSGTVTKRSF